jgi:hypothetical protein
MTKQVQRRRGTAAQHTGFTGAEGEISVNTTRNSVHVHDGVTAGGIEAARADMGNVSGPNILSAAGITATTTELNFTSGVTSGIQTQLNSKAPINNATFTGTTAIPSATITGGTINGTTIGASTASTGAFTTLSASSTATLNTLSSSGATITGGTINGTVIGGSTPAAISGTTGQFGTSLNVDGTITSDGLTVSNSVAAGPVLATISNSGASGAAQLLLNNDVQSWVVNTRVDDAFSVFNATSSTTPFLIATNGDISFYEDTGTTPKFFWDASAESLGIGTSSPLMPIHISGTGDVGIQITKQGSVASRIKNVAGALAIGVDGSNGDTERMRIDSAGDVGIGTSSPTNRLTVNSGAATTTAQFTSTGSSVFLGMTNSGSTAFIGAESSGAFVVQTPGSGFSTKMLIDSAGNVGIGTSSPQALLDVVGSGAPTRANVFAMARIAGGNSVANDLQLYGPNTSQVRINFGDPESENVGDISYNHSSNSMRFVTNASERLRIDSAGNVGIGTSSPSERLTVSGAISSTSNAADFNQPKATFDYASGAGRIAAHISTGSSLQFFTNPNGGSVAERMRIDSAGNVGIGTTPSAWSAQARAIQLGNFTAFYQNASGLPEITFNSFQNTSNVDTYRISANQATKYQLSDVHRWLTAVSGTAGDPITYSERMRITNAGDVGIGTSSPAAKLHVSYSAAAYSSLVDFRNTDTGTGGFSVATFAQSASGSATGIIGTGASAASNTAFQNTFGVGTQSNHAFTMLTNDTERMRIDSAGRIGVNRTPDSSIRFFVEASESHAGGFTNNQTVTAAATLFVRNNGTSGTRGLLEFRNSANNQVGNISHNGTSTTYSTSSDYRLKENVESLTNATDRLMQLPVYRFNFIANPDLTVDGFLAHEAQEVVPEAVTGEKDAVDKDGNPQYQGIDQSKIVPLLTAALQEALKRIEALEAQINS